MARSATPAPTKTQAKSPVGRMPRNREGFRSGDLQKRLAEASEQHAAISEILRVISSSPGDVTPVLATVAERAAHLCDASFAQVLLVEGNVLRPTVAYWADAGSDEEHDDSRGMKRTWPLTRSIISGRAVLDCKTIHYADVVPLLDSEYPDVPRATQQELGYRAVLVVPLMREGGASGVIFMFRREPRPFSPEQVALVETFASQAVIAIENVRLFNETKEALEQQTATSKILGVISQSPTDVQPVFDTIAQAAQRLCDATSANLFTFDGELLHLAAHARSSSQYVEADLLALRTNFPRPPGPDLAAPRAVLTCSVVSIPDVLADAEYKYKDAAVAGGFRSVLAVPLIRDGAPMGAIVVGRPEAGQFPDKQLALLQTFAVQAVIAIENVRLFDEVQAHARELSVSLQQQTATADVLKVISRSAFDLQKVLDTLAESACKLCEADASDILRSDGDVFRVAAMFGQSAAHKAALKQLVIRPGRDTCAGRTLLEGRTVHIRDAALDPEYDVPDVLNVAGNRAMIGVPLLLREGAPIGVLVLTRSVARPFTEKQIALATTFADQAVIAIENVRLFTELEAGNRDLTVALEQQTATSEILRVISRSPTEVQPVFETIVANAARLCSAESAAAYRFDGGVVYFVAGSNFSPEALEGYRHLFPCRLRETDHLQRVVDGSVLNISDIENDPHTTKRTGDAYRTRGVRSTVIVPMVREGRAIGAIGVSHRDIGAFSNDRVELLKTFADQAAIAIENMRLFTELRERTAQLSRSVDELTALGQVSQALSSTLDLEVVLTTIVRRAIELSGADGGSVYEYYDEAKEFRLRATQNFEEELVEASRAMPLRRGEGALGLLAERRQPIQIADIADPAAYQSRVREVLLRTGYRAILAIPLLRDDRLVGALVIGRKSAGDFPPGVIALLTTFANQSALAIQNARLFREIEVKSRELETASRHKSEFLANMSHELRTPLNAIIGFSEVLSQRMFGEINDKQAEYLADILESGQHLLSLINDILDLSKIEAGRMELEPAEFDLPTAIEHTLILVRERAQRHGITLGRVVDERLGTIRGDERKVKQVLLNLLSNALKFTPEGGQIEVRAEKQDGAVEISVRDTGVGIAPEDQEAVFEEFRQVGTASKKVEGTGLGLAISRKFIELHGGRIWVKSQVGAGSTFIFTLPLQ